MLIDSHCHLDYFEGEALAGVLGRAAAAGVSEMVTIGTRLAQSDLVRGIAESQPNVWCTIGIHPDNAGEHPVPTAETIAALTDHRKVVGIGESGLDYFYDKAPREAQQASFRAHIRAARMAGLPLVIHARDADTDIADILQNEAETGGNFAFLLHCFSSGRGLAETAVRMGGYVSFSGILTFRNPRRSAPSPATCRPSACWWRPMRRTWRRSRIVAAATSRPGSPTPRGCWRRSAAWSRQHWRR